MIDQDVLLKVLREEEDDAATYYSSELASTQAEAMNRYHALPYGDGSEVPNRSQVVTHDIEDTINWLMPHLLRVFAPSDELITCEDDALEDDDDTLETAAAYLSHVFYKDNKGEIVLHDFLFDGLLQKIGVARAYWVDPEPEPPQELEGVPFDQVLKYENDPEYEILQAQVDGELPPDEPEPQPQSVPQIAGPQGPAPGLMGGASMMMPQPQPHLPPVTFSLLVQRRRRVGRVITECVPPEEFRISRRAKSIETAEYHAWKHEVYLADLISDHPDKSSELDPDYVGTETANDDIDNISDERVQARFPDEPTSGERNYRNDIERRKVWLNIEYIRGDFDHDNVVELRRIKRTGNVILENEIVEDSEFVDWSPIRVSHRAIGRSLADTLVDIQKIRTVLTRKAMDSLSQSLAPRTYIDKNAAGNDEELLDRILDHDVGDVIPLNGNPRDKIYTETTPDVSASAFQAIEYWDRRSEEASGVNRHAMGIQPQAITETKGGIENLQAAANSRVEQVARWAAHGFEALLTKILKIIVQHQDQARVIKVSGKKMSVDPRRWSDDMSVSVHVGMAAETRERKLAFLGAIAGKQEAIMAQAGLDNPIVTPREYRNTLAQMVSVMGYKNPGQFFKDVPAEWQPPAPGEDPKTAEVKQKGELAAAELKGKQALAQAEIQGKQQMAQIEMQGRQQIETMQIAGKQRVSEMELAHKTQASERDAQIQKEIAQLKLVQEREIAELRLAQERELALQRMDMEKEMKREQLAAQPPAASANGKSDLPQFRDGGRLDA